MTTVEGYLVPVDGQKPKRKPRDWSQYSLPKRETQEAFAVYLRYRGMGIKRSLTGLYELLQTEAANQPPDAPAGNKRAPQYNTLARWSRAFNWDGRVREYDEEQARLYAAKWEERRMQMNEEHYGLARNQLIQVIGLIDGRLRDGTLSDTSAVSYANLMQRLQRQAAGEPTEVSEHKHTFGGKATIEHEMVVNPRDMTDDELESLRDLALDMKRREEEGDA